MSTFIRTDAGQINTRFIISIRDEKRPQKGCEAVWRKRVTYLEGADVVTTLSDEAYTDAVDQPVVAALPGYFFVNVFDCEPYETYLEPIVAWRIDGDSASPVGYDSLCDGWGILDPRGRVSRPWVSSFDSVENFRKDRIEQIQQENARRAAIPLPPNTAPISS